MNKIRMPLDSTIIWVFHQNCDNNCLHCFLKPTEQTTDVEVLKTALSLQKHGHKVRIHLADCSKPGALAMTQEFGFRKEEMKVLEFKNTLPSLDALDEIIREGVACGFSLHGHNDDLHGLICTEPDDFDITLNTLDRARQLNLKVFVNSVVHRRNYRFIGELCKLLEIRGIRWLRLGKLSYSILAARNLDGFFMEREDIIAFFEIVKKLRRKYRNRLIIEPVCNSFGLIQSRLKKKRQESHPGFSSRF